MPQKVIYFITGNTPTPSQQTEIDFLKDNFSSVVIRSRKGRSVLSGSIENCDYVAGTIPHEYSGVNFITSYNPDYSSVTATVSGGDHKFNSLGENVGFNTHVFLLVGQSNMVGRADNNNSGVYPEGTLQYGQSDSTIKAAIDPLDHFDENPGDMGLARQFCIDYASTTPNTTIILIPRADGGTSFTGGHWNKGDPQYNGAVNDTNTIMAANPGWELKGILWHQGESDNNASAAYETALYAMIQNMRTDIVSADDSTPFIVGNIKTTSAQYNATVNSVIENVPDYFPSTVLVDTEDLTHFDNLHYDGNSLDTMGSRYYSALGSAAANTKEVAENGADRHWLLGADNQLYLDLVGNHSLSENGATPRFEGGSLVIVSNGDGLASNIPETETMTACFVVKSAAQIENDIIGGTLNRSAAGHSLFFQENNGLIFNERGGIGRVTIDQSPPVDSWLFVACSLSSNGNYTLFRGDSNNNIIVTGNRSRNASTRNYSVGDVHYNTSGFGVDLGIAEAIFFMGEAKSAAEIIAIYLRSKTRLANRNITVV